MLDECEVCPTGYYSVDAKYTDAGKNTAVRPPPAICAECPKGYSYASSSGTQGPGACEQCLPGRYADVIGLIGACKLPKTGFSVSNDRTFQFKNVSVKDPSDCHHTNEFLDDDLNGSPVCRVCPGGGSCSGPITWSGVRAKFGYWRLRTDHDLGITPDKTPACLWDSRRQGENRKKKKQDSDGGAESHNSESYAPFEPCAVFIACLNPIACLGAPNLELKGQGWALRGAVAGFDQPANMSVSGANEIVDLALLDLVEACNPDQGFASNSRLCQRCQTGNFSRSLGSKCVQCGVVGENGSGSRDISGILALFILGALAALLFFAGLLRLRVQAFAKDSSFHRRRKAVHSVMKRILLSHLQTLRSVVALSVPWPPLLELIFWSMSSVANFSETANSIECFYAEQAPADFFFSTLIVAALLPFVIVGILAIFWFSCATRNKTVGCGVKIRKTTCHSARRGAKTQNSNTSDQVASDDSQGQCGGGKADEPRRLRDNITRRAMRHSHIHRTFVPSDMDSFLMSAVLLWFILLPSILRMAFVAMECKVMPASLDGEMKNFLLIDLEFPCYEGKHLSFMILAIPLVLAYAVIVPTAITLILFRAGRPKNKDGSRKRGEDGKLLEPRRNVDPTLMYRWGLWYSGYRSDRFWWEVVVLVRKVGIILISTFASSDQFQLHISLGLLIVSLHLHDTNRPYGNTKTEEHVLHWFEMGSLLNLLLMVWSGVFFFFQLCSNTTTISWCNALIVVVLLSNLGYLVYLFSQCCLKWSKRQHLAERYNLLVRHFSSNADVVDKMRKTSKGNDDGKGENKDVEMVVVTI